MFGGKEPWSFGLLAFCSNTSAIQTCQLGENEENLPFQLLSNLKTAFFISMETMIDMIQNSNLKVIYKYNSVT